MPYPKSASQFLGQTIDNGALTIVGILGAGAFGVVYRAFDTNTGVQYAVKRVKGGSEYSLTFERQLHARVSAHPNVLTFHREIHEGPYTFFVYDLCAGDLHSFIKNAAFFREDELIKRVFLQIVDAISYCHERGVYHRDLKPENILVSAESGGDIDIFVADFGLATTSKMTTSSCGTPCFMSPGMLSLGFSPLPLLNPIPESLVPDHDLYATAQGDVWALGCILAEMIGDSRPWNLATLEDRDYSDYLMDRNVLFEMLPISHPAYLLLRKIFSIRPECRPSLGAIRTEVLALDTFFLTNEEAVGCGWVERMEKQMRRKLRAREAAAPSSVRSSKTSSGSDCFKTCSLGSSSVSRYSTGSSTSAFDSSSDESSEAPVTPPAPAAKGLRTTGKASRLVLLPCVAAAHGQTF
jgi:serine/threonine protein kinase